jgi:hypothetical protein
LRSSAGSAACRVEAARGWRGEERVNAFERVHQAVPHWCLAHERRFLICLLAAAIGLRFCLVVFAPTPAGYVWDFYSEGVRYLYAHGRLPLPTDCAECYHPPLFYLLGWPLYAIGDRLGGGEHAALRWLGVLPMACGAITVYFGYRFLRLFRLRGGPLIFGVALLLTFPCLVISSYGADADILVTAILSALIFYLTRDAAFGPPSRLVATIRLGVLAGLAAATKYSGLVGVASILVVFSTLRIRGLLHAVGPDADAGELTDLPVYRSVFTTLHGLAWSDMNFFSEPGRHGDPARPYPSKRQVWGLTASVLLLGVIPDVLALLGATVCFTRRSLRPALIFSAITLTTYGLWFTTQTAWGLKTKYILFLLPPAVLFAIEGVDWIWRRAPAPVGVCLAGLLAALVVLTHAYLLIFSIG